MKRILLKIIAIIIIYLIYILISNNVQALTIVLDPGHGGEDNGASCLYNNSMPEKVINLKIAQYLKEYLKNYEDLNILLTRDDDTYLSVFDRGIYARNNNADLLISIHMNSTSTENAAKGAEVFVTANTSLEKYNKKSTELGNKILNNLNLLGIENRGVKTRLITNDDTDRYSDNTIADYYGVIRYSMRGCKIDSGVISPNGAIPANIQYGEGIPAIIIEHCFLNNNSEYQYYSTEEALKKLAKADADAIISQYGLKLKETDNNIMYKTSGNNIILRPDTSLKYVQTKEENFNFEGNIFTTGNSVNIDNKEYIIIRLGDPSGDGEINSADLLTIVKHLKEKEILKDEYLSAGDVTSDNKIDSADLLSLVKYLKGTSKILLNQEDTNE